MKAVIISFVMLFSGAALAQESGACYDGQKATIDGVKLVCMNGVFMQANPAKYKCQDGDQQYFPVKGVYFGKNELSALATCTNGKWLFENDEYNYQPTQGKNKCKEGKTWIEGQDKGNPGIKYVCKGGKAVSQGKAY